MSSEQPRMDFNSKGDGPNNAEVSLTAIAEHTIARTITEGKEHMTDEGMRFIRYMLSISRAARFGFLPNFNDKDAVLEMARHFIRYCGGASMAMRKMHRVLEGEA